MRTAVGLVILLVVAFASALRAQTTNASVTGQITDPSKALIVGANVTLINAGTNLRYEGMTNGSGSYYVTDLPAGTYRLVVERSGFKTVIKPEITLHVQDIVEVNFEMPLGSTSEIVSVTGGAPLVQLSTSTISGVVDSTTVRELPLNGRDWTQLATLEPGVISANEYQQSLGTSNSRGFRGFGSEMSITGTRPTQNNYRIDGINANDYTNNGPASAVGITLGVDAIQEFSVLTANYTAEYGRTSGGVINAITRAGTDQLHGNVYEFIRNSALDAANFFDNFTGTAKPPFRRNQFGGSVGGPIRKDRTFFFADYEGFRQSLGFTNVDTVPSAAARGGDLCSLPGGANPPCTPTTITVNANVVPFLPLWPLPNGPLLGNGDTGVFSIATNQISTENFVTGRVDHTIGEKDTLFGSYLYDASNLSLPDPLNDVLNINATGRQLVSIEESHIFSSRLVNSFRVGYSRSVGILTNPTAINALAGNQALGAVPGKNPPEIDVPSLTTFEGGPASVSNPEFYSNSFQGYDDVSLTRGIQTLKFGFAVERLQLNEHLTGQRAGGRFQFGSLQNFLANAPGSFSASLGGGLTSNERAERQTILGAYVQDDVRWRSNLTVNLGLRYEMSTVPTEIHGRFAALGYRTDPTPHIGNPLFSNPTRRNFEPRVGIAWDPFRDGKTSVRASFGMFDVLPLLYQTEIQQIVTAPFQETGTVSPLPPGSFPSGALAAVSSPTNALTGYVEAHPHRNYVMTWNLNVQREVLPNLAVMVAYVGSEGVHMPFEADDSNIVLPTLTPTGYLWPFPAGSGTRLNPNIGQIGFGLQWNSTSSYQGLQTKITKRMGHGLQAQGSYTWSKAIDEGDGTSIGDPFTNSITSLYFFDPRLRRGLADFNVAQNLTVSYTWDVPSPPPLHGPAAWVAGGWQLGGILQMNSGQPFTVLIGGDPLGLNSFDPFAYPNRLTGPGCQSLVNPGNVKNYIKLNCFGLPMAPASLAAQCTPFSAVPGTCSNLLGNSRRNILTGPGLTNFDFSLFKNNYIKRISEVFNVQFRVELFNVFNHPNFAAPVFNNFLFDSTGAPVGGAGLLSSTTTAAREIQFGLKLIW
jgi:hypothetical protein